MELSQQPGSSPEKASSQSKLLLKAFCLGAFQLFFLSCILVGLPGFVSGLTRREVTILDRIPAELMIAIAFVFYSWLFSKGYVLRNFPLHFKERALSTARIGGVAMIVVFLLGLGLLIRISLPS